MSALSLFMSAVDHHIRDDVDDNESDHYSSGKDHSVKIAHNDYHAVSTASLATIERGSP